ncbi:MAG: signal transduction protein [Piscirickettsiaceae bacterium]|nr:MAG: signal transduction protein [Piscirickettsiaceae bacterium]
MNIDELVANSVELASLPDVCIRLNEGIDNPHFSAKDLADILMLDTALTSILLKIVNSSFYNFTAPIDTISRAITVVGIDDLRSLVFAASSIGAFKNIATDLVDVNDFWVHSLYTAVAARRLAKHYSILHPERLFIMGLLHDVGHLLMYHHLPKKSADVLMRTQGEPQMVADVEQEVFGYDHAQVGARLLKSWRLSDNIIEAVNNHHNPTDTGDAVIEANITYLANQMTTVFEHGMSVSSLMDEVDFKNLAINEISMEDMESLTLEIPALFTESKVIIAPLAV